MEYDINACRDPDLIKAHRALNRLCNENSAIEAEQRDAHDAVDRRFAVRLRELDVRYQAAEREFQRLHDLWAARQERAAA